MRTVTILFGTETGNAEMVADEIATALADFDTSAEVHSMGDYPVDELGGQPLVILITSTYGEGDLPDTAIPFFDALKALQPDLSSTRFAAFGLGDSSYDTYNNGIETLIAAVTGLGATQIGETGRHDADSGLDPCDTATTWVRETFAHAEV
ncbi:flavodoxin domain-containing protein [Mycolicibacterium smegmatis]|uniref:flavodoxin domain-containing protein n=1 Tax=Mycolicibacterium smegmatis TaxID=1772 RepID=UPI0005D85BB6|nr:flavodoxin domain-containing protein [Mycolicibacterium smegmatis]MDF1900786.1 flavodoxin domain-containing protein [Mycolicibacterium smegmatis]MDF1907065.1 flavodoxin domain-containing protein [Mycolicibacterium smegmatis]MDF1919260.1 flavodoxin domain-containing protein [Mycolicibacterium smegmatis]MDF1925327.1 flavodoxin domain-containing protein [Mycolicibacterium smegmatis]UAK52886.1 flavodoxin domain-containing protein [Mycolicibacterium smegmatis]